MKNEEYKQVFREILSSARTLREQAQIVINANLFDSHVLVHNLRESADTFLKLLKRMDDLKSTDKQEPLDPCTAQICANPESINKYIDIALSGDVWLDLTNGMAIGDKDQLVEYVNSNKYKVNNDSVFLYMEKFWYTSSVTDNF